MNGDLNTDSVKRLLSRSTDEIDRPTLDGLRAARDRALERYDMRAAEPAFAWAGAARGAHRRPAWPQLYRTAAMLLLVTLFCTAAYTYLQHQREHDETDVDIAILTDEIPVNVYAD